MKAISLLLFISFIHYSFPLFKKYGSDISYSGFATFDTREFDEGEEMYFKVEAFEAEIIDMNILYYYKNDIAGTSIGNTFNTKVTSTSSYTENNNYYTRKYFKIKKQKSQFEPAGTGNYLVISLPVVAGDYCRIENTKEDEGGIPTWAIVVIIVVIVLIIVGVIIYCCYRRKKRMQQMSQTNAATVAVASAYATQQNLQAQAYQAQAYQAQAYQAQAYQAQVNQAQAQAYQAQVQANQQAQAQAHYQEQMNAAPNYSQQNYQTPVNSNDVVGYSSKAVM